MFTQGLQYGTGYYHHKENLLVFPSIQVCRELSYLTVVLQDKTDKLWLTESFETKVVFSVFTSATQGVSTGRSPSLPHPGRPAVDSKGQWMVKVI